MGNYPDRVIVFKIYRYEAYFYYENFLMKIRNILLGCLVTVIASSGCKKVIQKIEQDLMVNLITQNNWVIVKYAEGTRDSTANYSTYYFKFNKDWSVEAINNGVTEAKGTWLGSQATQSITSNFPTAGAPINKLNGVWIVVNTKSKPWRVYSHRYEGSTEIVLNLQEKQ